jgi:hypothetical protein
VENIRAGRELSIFPKTLPMAFFRDSQNLPHYARETIGERLAERFMFDGIAYGLLGIPEEPQDHIRFASKGKTIKTVLSNYQNGYLNGLVDKNARAKAERLAAEEFLRSQSTLARFQN